VGKTTICKLLAKRIDLKYVSSDEIGEKHTKELGGLDKMIKSGEMDKIIKEKGYSLIEEEYKKDNFIFDLSGGSISSIKNSEASERLREVVKKNSIVIGLLPFKEDEKSIKFLFEREKERKHFKNLNKEELFEKTSKDYLKYPLIFKDFCDFIFYVEDNSVEQIVEEIRNKLPSRGSWQANL
jgi:shikimate kinase